MRDHVAGNRRAWASYAPDYVDPGRRNWAASEETWGVFGVPESAVGMLPADLNGVRSIELGCGTGYVSAWLARRGARPVGLDLTDEQLASAVANQAEFGPAYPLVQGDAERAPFADGSFDLAISEYGACLWCDPARWVPEAARLLRPGGELIFLTNASLLVLCTPDDEGDPATDRMLRPYFGLGRMEWPDDPGVEFHLTHGDWVRLLRGNGFEVTDLIEVQVPADATTRYPFVTGPWANRWPAEEVWKARKRA